MTRAAWTVRTGKYGERDDWALSNGFAGGGWTQYPDLSPIQSREAMSQLVLDTIGAERQGAIPNYAGQLWALRERIQVGDLVVLPLKTVGQVALGTVTGPYKYISEEPDPAKRHVIPVNWQRTDVPRTAFKQDLLNILGSALTVFQSTRNDAAYRLDRVCETGVDPGARVSSPLASGPFVDEVIDGEADVASISADIADYAETAILTRVQETFANHDLTRLVSALLVARGYQCEMKPVGPDGGVDILAGSGPLGLDSPKIVVQVKSENTQVGDPVVQTLQGAIKRFSADQALLVAWGGVNSRAAKFLETEKFNIKVWDSQDVLREIYASYDKLPADIRAAMPLKQVWIPVDGG